MRDVLTEKEVAEYLRLDEGTNDGGIKKLRALLRKHPFAMKTLNPSKLSGVCDRLKCCLTYEYDYYRQMAKYMPRRGQMVRTLKGDGPYKVREVNYMDGTVVVDLSEGIKQKLFYRDLEKVK